MINSELQLKTQCIEDLHTLSQSMEKLSISEIKTISKHVKKYTVLKNTYEYEQLINRLKEVRKYKLPFRIVEKENNSDAAKALEKSLLVSAEKNEDVLRVVEPICFIHGTTSALLAFLPYTGFTIKPTGQLLEPNEKEAMIAPMCGELRTGIDQAGINQRAISGETIRGIDRCWRKYAKDISKSFDAKRFANPEQFFRAQLDKFGASAPDQSGWDEIAIAFLQLKQWSPDIFVKLCKEHAETIKWLLKESKSKTFAKEHLVLKALDFNEERLKKAESEEDKQALLTEAGCDCNNTVILDSTNWGNDLISRPNYFFEYYFDVTFSTIIGGILAMKKNGSESQKAYFDQTVRQIIEGKIEKKFVPYKKRWQRMQRVFRDPPRVRLDDQQRQWITKSFPLLLASTRLIPRFYIKEFLIDRPVRLGEEIDICFAKNAHIDEVSKWLKTHGLKVALHPSSILKKAKQFPLIHAPSQAIEAISSHLSNDLQRELANAVHKKVLPHYRAPYPGIEYAERQIYRPIHGVVHAAGTALLCNLLAEMYSERGVQLRSQPGDVEFGGGMHDSARLNDGQDLWDKESGAKCAEELRKVHRTPEEIEVIEKAIANKESSISLSLEHEIIHDADCLEILRLIPLEEFKKEKLWFMKRFGSSPDLEQLIKEVKLFIDLKESHRIKWHLEMESEQAYAELFLILNYAHQQSKAFPMMYRLLFSAIEAFETEQKKLLTPDLKKTIKVEMRRQEKGSRADQKEKS